MQTGEEIYKEYLKNRPPFCNKSAIILRDHNKAFINPYNLTEEQIKSIPDSDYVEYVYIADEWSEIKHHVHMNYPNIEQIKLNNNEET